MYVCVGFPVFERTFLIIIRVKTFNVQRRLNNNNLSSFRRNHIAAYNCRIVRITPFFLFLFFSFIRNGHNEEHITKSLTIVFKRHKESLRHL